MRNYEEAYRRGGIGSEIQKYLKEFKSHKKIRNMEYGIWNNFYNKEKRIYNFLVKFKLHEILILQKYVPFYNYIICRNFFKNVFFLCDKKIKHIHVCSTLVDI